MAQIEDGNTKLFYTSTLVRRRRNKTESLVNDDGGVDQQHGAANIHGHEILFGSLYNGGRGGCIIHHWPLPFDQWGIQQKMTSPFTLEETKKALDQMGS